MGPVICLLSKPTSAVCRETVTCQPGMRYANPFMESASASGKHVLCIATRGGKPHQIG